MISDVPHVTYTEGRFLPYFFPDTFNETGNPVEEANQNWIQARRAILRSPIQRMGFGGYLSLVLEFPEFVQRVEEITNEFREIHEQSKGTEAYRAPFKVAILNSWGKSRKWMSHHVHHAIWYKQTYSYYGILEALSGMPFAVEFISFNDVKTTGIPDGIGIIMNAGDAGTSWSGGEAWLDVDIVSRIREWVADGGGFIGVGEPTAIEHQGEFFQLADILGVQKEVGFSLSLDKYNILHEESHFITKESSSPINFGESMKHVYQADRKTTVLAMEEGDVTLAANEFEQGRSVYMAGLPYSSENARLLLRAIYWAASREKMSMYGRQQIFKPNVLPTQKLANMLSLITLMKFKKTGVYKEDGSKIDVTIAAMGYKWFEI